MAKSKKFQQQVPALEELKPSWVNADGEVDVEKAKKAIHTLMLDKAVAQDAREDALAGKKDAESQAAELQKTLDEKSDPDTQKELEKARAAQVKAESERDEASLRADRIEIAAEKNLTPSQAKRLVGKDREELEADADQLIKDLGLEPKNEDGEDEDEEGRVAPKPRVRTGLVNGGDPANGANSGEVDYEKIAADISGGSVF